MRLSALFALAWATLLVTPRAAADPDRLETLVTTVCQACHMADGNSVVPIFPKLAGQQETYLRKQLQDFLDGQRSSEIMAPVVSQISASDVEGLAAYYAALPSSPGNVTDPQLVTVGRDVYQNGNEDTGVPACEACHQPEGQGNERYPGLAGQHQAYTIQEMHDFRSGTRANDRGRIMRRIAERLTEDEIAAVAEFVAGLPETESP